MSENLHDNRRKAIRARVPSRKQIFDLKQLLEISKSLTSTLDYSTLIESILYICMGQMKVLGVGIFTKKNFDSSVFSLNRNYSDFELAHSYEYNIPDDHALVDLLCETNKCYTLPELEKKLTCYTGIEGVMSLSPSLIVPLKVKSHINGILLLGDRIDLGEGTEFSDYEREQILNIASLAAIAIHNTALIEMTTTDMMTHLKLKHYFYSVLVDKLEAAAAENIPLSVMMLDIDFFKRVNDTYGHAAGDTVLQAIAAVIQDNIRAKDLAARYGGEEFVVMLFGAGVSDAVMIAERIRKSIETLDIEYENQHVSVTNTIGAADFRAERNITAKALVDQADQALYLSKQNGRNKVTSAVSCQTELRNAK